MKNALEYFLTRLQEPSTVRGIVMLAGGLGITIDPIHLNEMIALVFILVGTINVWKKDASSKDSEVMEAIKNE